jgi:hypothetical protein
MENNSGNYVNKNNGVVNQNYTINNYSSTDSNELLINMLDKALQNQELIALLLLYYLKKTLFFCTVHYIIYIV